MQRRGFLSAILGAAAAPAIVSASSLMKLVPTESGILTLTAFDEWVQGMDSTVYMRPTKLLVPATLRAECLKILNAEFDKQYALTTRRIL